MIQLSIAQTGTDWSRLGSTLFAITKHSTVYKWHILQMPIFRAGYVFQ